MSDDKAFWSSGEGCQCGHRVEQHAIDRGSCHACECRKYDERKYTQAQLDAARAEGETVGLERAAARCKGIRDGIASNLSHGVDSSREGGINTATHCVNEIRALQPDPDYRSRVKREVWDEAILIARTLSYDIQDRWMRQAHFDTKQKIVAALEATRDAEGEGRLTGG